MSPWSEIRILPEPLRGKPPAYPTLLGIVQVSSLDETISIPALVGPRTGFIEHPWGSAIKFWIGSEILSVWSAAALACGLVRFLPKFFN
ncbi:hypothetical protein Nwat_0157 [Nitrosococcus watsonii C-113]|uniref:Uncharacterized protein n=1 Tax=Nitrosococcus watsoni (strain C-113) TaxID=105559 RepID=D8K8S1_NITWC|nr:hypothetical protein Nwat_0157 [Nitrosococcus watsonii C-113]